MSQENRASKNLVDIEHIPLHQILAALSEPKREPTGMPDTPGLYAVYGDAATWHELGLGPPVDQRPLYVGKAEDSLLKRDFATHFNDGRTGSSTLRRSLAALLRTKLGLTGVPRNLRNPEKFSNYGLSPADDRKLTAWMLSRLKLAIWTPLAAGVSLDTEETRVLHALEPPLNLKKVQTPWAAVVSAARKVLAMEAEAWAKAAGLEPLQPAPVSRPAPVPASGWGQYGTVGPPEIAARLGVTGLEFRDWLRELWRQDDPRFAGHVHGARWWFTPEQAAQLEQEFRSRR